MSRFFKIIFTKWFYIHAFLQTAGVVGIVSGFVIVRCFIFQYQKVSANLVVNKLISVFSSLGYGLEHTAKFAVWSSFPIFTSFIHTNCFKKGFCGETGSIYTRMASGWFRHLLCPLILNLCDTALFI